MIHTTTETAYRLLTCAGRGSHPETGNGVDPTGAHLPHTHAASRLTRGEQLSSVALSKGSSNREIRTFPVASRQLGEMTTRPSPNGPAWMGEAIRGCPTPIILV